MRREDLIKHWDVICAFKDGAEVEFFSSSEEKWTTEPSPAFYRGFEYRIKSTKPTKPSIDWSHVHPDFKWLAVDEDGEGRLYTSKPEKGDYYWYSRDEKNFPAHAFASYKAGINWADSLVERPEGV
jgi:hypothetical protein